MDIINRLRFNEESDLFALERDRGLESIIKKNNSVAQKASRVARKRQKAASSIN